MEKYLEMALEWISVTFNVEAQMAQYIFYGACLGLGLLILIIIICSVSSCKKKKAKKAKAKVETKEEVKEETVEEVVKTPVEEEQVEETAVEETPVEEVPAVEETPVEEVKEVEVEKEKTTTKTTKKVAPKKVDKPKETKVEVPVEEVKEEIKEEKPVQKRTLGKFAIAQEGVNYRYRLKASNGELLVVSELYASEKACRTGIETIKKNAESAKIEVVEDKHGLFSFRIMTKQGRCLATSANYKTKARALSASESFKKFVVTERIEVEEAADHFEVEEFTKEITPEEKGKYKISRAQDGYIYQLVASNGRVIATSQTYKSEASCKESLEKFRALAYEGTFYIFKDKNAKFQFKLYNKQKRLVLAGEVYDTKDRVVSVIESIKRFAKHAEVVNLPVEVTEA